MPKSIEPEEESLTQRLTTTQIVQLKQKNKDVYYLPCYVRFKVKELINIDVSDLTATVSGTLLVSIYYGNLSMDIVKPFSKGNKPIMMQFSRQESILLKEDKGITFQNNTQMKMLNYVIRQEFTCFLIGNIFLTPFELIDLNLTVTFQPSSFKRGSSKVEVRVNCMDSKKCKTIDHGQKKQLGLYSMATYFLEAKFTSVDKNPFQKINVFKNTCCGSCTSSPKVSDQSAQQKPIQNMDEGLRLQNTGSISLVQEKKAQETKLRHFQYAHFRIPIYKYPGTSLIEIFLPLWLLAFINLIVFFQQNILGDKLATIATITLAYIAFIPTINDTIPNTPIIKFVDILIYAEVFTTILSAIDALYTAQDQPIDFVFNWRNNSLYIICCIIDAICVIVVISMFIMHKSCWEKAYTAKKDRGNQKLDITNWENEECDKEFNQYNKKNGFKLKNRKIEKAEQFG